MKKRLIILLAAAGATGVLVIGLAVFFIWGGNDQDEKADAYDSPETAAINVADLPDGAPSPDQVRRINYEPILDASHWLERFPYQTESFLKERQYGAKKNYLEIYPFLNTIFAGSRFAEAYYSPLPHDYAIENVKLTPRLTPQHPAGCFGCKTPDYPIMEAADPAAMWSRGFYEVESQMNSTITCYDCHRNTPGRGISGSTGYYDRGFVGSIRSHFDVFYQETRGATAACAQCHNEYFFHPETRQVTLPPGITDPTLIFEFYNHLGIVDHVNPYTGTEQLKVQHPEYQHFVDSIHQDKGLTCVDCHMQRSTPDGTGGFISNHMIQRPSDSEEILQSCTRCHLGGAEGVRTLIRQTQDSMNTRTNTLGDRLAAFQTNFAAAIEADNLTSAQIDELRALDREATWYFDWVFSENGDGVHNYAAGLEWLAISNRVLDNAERILQIATR